MTILWEQKKLRKTQKVKAVFPQIWGNSQNMGGFSGTFSPPDLGEFTFLISKILPWGIPVSSVPPDCLQLFSADPNENLDNLTQKRGLPDFVKLKQTDLIHQDNIPQIFQNFQRFSLFSNRSNSANFWAKKCSFFLNRSEFRQKLIGYVNSDLCRQKCVQCWQN